MRKFLIALAILSLSTACAPQASGPPAGDSGATTSSSGLSAPETPAGGPDAAATPAGHPPMDGASPGAAMPPGHPPMSGGASPPPGHMDAGGANVTSTDGAVVSVQGTEMIMARPGGTELRFILPEDLKILPEGKTREDLKEGTRIAIDIRTVEKGMEAKTITIQDMPPAQR